MLGADQHDLGVGLIASGPHDVALATAVERRQRPALVGQLLAGAEALQTIDVEPGLLGLGLPQVDQAAAQRRVVEQVGPVQVQLDVGDR